MARTALTATRLTAAGVDLDAAATAAEQTDGNSFAWAEHRILYVHNGGGTTVTLTFVTPGTVGRGGLAVADATAVVAAGERRQCGPFGLEFRQPDRSVHVDYAGGAAGVMVAALDADPSE
ncbi:hypothetical protein [Salinispora arenicola]|uniref:hypothetical protein n=1 Tax=Salinispora arenicola TaxID=168697 RepID=UPI0003670449|nr:hypothetical protein [Salinispora arenicola]